MPTSCKAKITLANLCISVDATRQVRFRVLQQQYGDGYMARRQDGLNPVSERWSVSTPAMPVDDAMALEQELIALGGSYFDWTPPNEAVSKKWVLDPVSWEFSYPSSNLATVSFGLLRWYE